MVIPLDSADDPAIILVGGMGTRLGSLTADVPKPMLPVGGRPFVEYLVHQLRRSGFRTIILASGYRSDRLRAHFGSGEEFGVIIRYSEEDEPLGTGGAIRLAGELVRSDRFLVMNGDSFLDADPRTVLGAIGDDIMLSMALTRVLDARRYGTVIQADDGTVVEFASNGATRGPATINAGIYGASTRLLDIIPANAPCSFERDILPSLVGNSLLGIPMMGFFIDIGIPDTYRELSANPEPLLAVLGASQPHQDG